MKSAKTLIERNKPATEYNTDGHTLARLPDYLFVGPMRCGTSWIFNCLKRSGLVNLPLQKEIFYFDRNYHLGTAWYCGQFKSTDFKKPTVEVAPSLFHHPTAPGRVKDTLPHTKIIVITRETLTRAWSHYLHLKRLGLVEEDLEEAIKLCPEIVDASRYQKHIDRWRSFFGSEHVSILSFDEIEKNPTIFLSRLSTLVGIDREKLESIPTKINQSTESRFDIMTQVLRKIASWLRKKKLFWLINTVKKIGLKKIIYPSIYKEPSSDQIEILERYLTSDEPK